MYGRDVRSAFQREMLKTTGALPRRSTFCRTAVSSGVRQKKKEEEEEEKATEERINK